eukprot:COSAG01_NODE_2085_length_8459_cov_14.269139_10_plen_92_part_00
MCPPHPASWLSLALSLAQGFEESEVALVLACAHPARQAGIRTLKYSGRKGNGRKAIEDEAMLSTLDPGPRVVFIARQRARAASACPLTSTI